MTGSDVSHIVDYPRQTEPAAMCRDGEHVIGTNSAFVSSCLVCGYSLQSLRDWWGHEVTR